MGTRSYMAPEQAREEPTSSMRGPTCTRWAPSCEFLLEAPGRTEAGAGAVPRAIRSVASRATRGEPEDRYPDAAALSADVARFLDGAVPAAHRENLFERLGRFASRHRTAILLVLTYLVVRASLILFLGR